ncbi:hypothetical protein LEMLEM_LOCUS21508, partial [Lemmus lemmus]
MGFPLASNSIRTNPVKYRKLHWVTRDEQLRLCLPCYLVISFRSPSHMYIFEEVY